MSETPNDREDPEPGRAAELHPGMTSDDPAADAAFAQMLREGIAQSQISIDKIRRTFYGGADVPQGRAFDSALEQFVAADLEDPNTL